MPTQIADARAFRGDAENMMTPNRRKTLEKRQKAKREWIADLKHRAFMREHKGVLPADHELHNWTVDIHTCHDVRGILFHDGGIDLWPHEQNTHWGYAYANYCEDPTRYEDSYGGPKGYEFYVYGAALEWYQLPDEATFERVAEVIGADGCFEGEPDWAEELDPDNEQDEAPIDYSGDVFGEVVPEREPLPVLTIGCPCSKCDAIRFSGKPFDASYRYAHECVERIQLANGVARLTSRYTLGSRELKLERQKRPNVVYVSPPARPSVRFGCKCLKCALVRESADKHYDVTEWDYNPHPEGVL